MGCWARYILLLSVGFLNCYCASQARRSKMVKQYKAVKIARHVTQTTVEPEAPKEKVQTQVLRIVNEKKFNLADVVAEVDEKKLISAKPPELKSGMADYAVNPIANDTGPSRVPASATVSQPSEALFADEVPEVKPNSNLVAQNKTDQVAPASQLYSPEFPCFPIDEALGRFSAVKISTKTLERNRVKLAAMLKAYYDREKVEFEAFSIQEGHTLQKVSGITFGTIRRWPELFLINEKRLKSWDKIYVGTNIDVPSIKSSAEILCGRKFQITSDE